MALFGILKGDSSRLSSQPFHEGYCYYEVDTGKFWIDALDDSNNQIRRCINNTSIKHSVLRSNGWTGGTYNLSVDGLTVNSNGIASIAQSATSEQFDAATGAMMRVTGQSAGTLTIMAQGKVPTMDIPVTVIIFD